MRREPQEPERGREPRHVGSILQDLVDSGSLSPQATVAIRQGVDSSRLKADAA